MQGVHVSCPDVAVRLSFSLGSLYRPNTSRIRAVLASAGSGVRGGSRGSAVSALGGLGARGGRPGSLYTDRTARFRPGLFDERANSKTGNSSDAHIIRTTLDELADIILTAARRRVPPSPESSNRGAARGHLRAHRGTQSTSARSPEPRARQHPRPSSLGLGS